MQNSLLLNIEFVESVEFVDLPLDDGNFPYLSYFSEGYVDDFSWIPPSFSIFGLGRED